MPVEQPPARVSSGRGLRVFAIRGVPVFVSPFALLFALIVGQLDGNLAQRRLPGLERGQLYALVALIAVGFLASLVLHEMGHALVAQRLGFDVRSITILGFAGFTEYRPEAQAPWPAFLVSVCGPLVNLTLGGALTGGYLLVNPNSAGGLVLFALAFTNVALGVFNLIPGLPLDGGHVLQAGIWKLTGSRLRATRAAAYAGFAVAVALGLYALSQSSASGGTWSLITLLTAVLLGTGAYQTLRQAEVRSRLPGLTASNLARPALPVDGSVPLAEALRRAQTAGATAVVVIDGRGVPTGLMNGAAADATPVDRRPWVSLSSVSRPLTDDLRVPASVGGDQLLRLLEESPASEYLVVGPDGNPVGVLAAVDLVARLSPQAAARTAGRA